MTQTNIDYLFQITPAATDRTYPVAGATGVVGKFDDHLSQAATYSGDDSLNRASNSQRTETTSYKRDDRSWNSGASKPVKHDQDRSTSSHTSSVNAEPSADAVSESNPPSENGEGDEHETDDSYDTPAAEVTGASQTAKISAQKAGAQTESIDDSDAAATAKAATLSKKAATEAGDPEATGDSHVKTTGARPSPDVGTQVADGAMNLVADAASDTVTTDEDANESQATNSEGHRLKADKSDASTAKSNKEGVTHSIGAVSDDSLIDGAETAQISSEAAQKANDHLEASAGLASATASNDKSEPDGWSDDNSRASSQVESPAGVHSDSVPTNKIDAVLLAGSVSAPTDAGANTTPQGKDNEQATKPIAAKGELVAAAFSRMTRHNVTESNASSSGASDLPPVDPSRFIGRVAKAFQTAQDRGGTLQLRLSPPELGALRIELNVKDGVMSASLQTENASARRLLLDHLPGLRDRLAEQNIRVDRFDVDVRRDGTGEQTDARGSAQQQFQHQPDEPAHRRQPQLRAREVTAPEKTVITPSVSDTGLNLIV